MSVQVESIPPKSAHKATVIIFHGAGDSGEDFKYTLTDVKKNFKYNNIKIVLPSATTKPYTSAGGVVDFRCHHPLTVHAGVVVNPKLAGIFSIGAFLPHDSMVFDKLQRRGNNSNAEIPKIFMTHCSDQGIWIVYHLEPYGGRSVGPSQMEWADKFIKKCLQSE